MNEKMLIPVSILIAGIVIGLGVFFTGNNKTNTEEGFLNNNNLPQTAKRVNINTDNILGNLDAEVFIIEYSDFECPFCKAYYENVSKKLQAKYLEDGKVAFVFRHMPITAFKQAVAVECAGELAGREKFFDYKTVMFSETKSDGKFDLERLPEIADSLGIDKESFKECLTDTKISDRVYASLDEGSSAGVVGTPTIFIQLRNSRPLPIPADFTVINESINTYFSQTK